MRVLVTGGAGYIGSHTCKRLAAEGHVPITFDDLSTGHAALARYGPLVRGDITDRQALASVFARHRPEAVIHFAARSHVGESARYPQAYFRTNVGGTTELVDAALAAGVERFVFSSSCSVYGVPAAMPIAEPAATMPISPYGASKLACEMLLRGVTLMQPLRCVALRYFNAAGADPAGEIGEAHDPETHVIPLMLMAAAGTRPGFRILGDDYATPDGTCIRDYLHVDDLAEAHVRAIQAPLAAKFEAINLGTGRGHSVRELVDTARAVTGRSFDVTVEARRPGDPPMLVADARKAHDLLGWTATRSDLDHILRTAWTWTRSANNPLRLAA